MTVRDFAGFLSRDEITIYRLARQKKLLGFSVAGNPRLQLQDIQGWIDLQKKLSTPSRARKDYQVLS